MGSEKQYIDIFQSSEGIINAHSAEPLNTLRDAAFSDFRRLGFPSKKVERYKYIDIDSIFKPNYGLNLNRLDIPVNPYDVFRCDVPNLSTLLYFVVNDSFYTKAQPHHAAARRRVHRQSESGCRYEAGAGGQVLWQDSTYRRRRYNGSQHHAGTRRALCLRSQERKDGKGRARLSTSCVPT